MRFLIPIAAAFLLVSCEKTEAPHPNTTEAPAAGLPSPSIPALEKLWVSEGFSAPEGVAAAPGGGYFISNVSGGGDEKDGEGWVTHLSEAGEILEERVVDGFDAPKGMVVFENVLYIADIDHVRRFSLTDKTLLDAIPVEGAAFLNDATVWNGAVYISDSRTARIHKIDGDAAPVWLESDALSGVNGLLGVGDTLLITTMDAGALYAANSDGALTTIATGMSDGDGVGLVPSGGFLMSAWRGDIFYISKTGEKTKLLDTRDEGILQNDLTVFGNTVIVPNWQPGTVTAWRIGAATQD